MPNRVYTIEVTQEHIDRGTVVPKNHFLWFGDDRNPMALAVLDSAYGFTNVRVSYYHVFSHFMGGPRWFRISKEARGWMETLNKEGKDAVEPFAFEFRWG